MTPDRKLRVALISHHQSDPDAGAAGADFRLGEALKELGCAVDYFFYDRVLPSRVKGIYRQILFPWFVAFHVWREHRRSPYSVIEATAGDAYLLRSLIKVFRLSMPVFSIRTHGLEHPRAEIDRKNIIKSGKKLRPFSGFYHFRYRLNEITKDLSSGDVVFLLNEPDREYCIERLGIDREKIHVTRNALPSYFFHDQGQVFNRDHLNKLLFIGGWIQTKGVDVLSAIVTKLFSIDPSATLTCAGVLTTREVVLSSFPHEYHARISVIPKYKNEELPSILKHHGVQIAPSVTEGCSVSILECLSAGLIVLSTPCGSAPEIIHNRENGFLISAENPGDYVKVIQELKANPDYAARISDSARKSVEGFTWDVTAKKRLDLWTDVIGSAEKNQTIRKQEPAEQTT